MRPRRKAAVIGAGAACRGQGLGALSSSADVTL